MIDDIAINFYFSENFANMEDKRRKCSCKDLVCGPSLNIGYVGPMSPRQ